MNFRYNTTFRQQDRKVKKLDKFLGVDFANSKLNAADFRAIDMKNFIYKDGVNHKRNGWNEVAKFGWDIATNTFDPKGTPLAINGFWEYSDSYGKNHIIVHAGTKIFSIHHFEDNSFDTVITDITNTNTYYPSYSNLSAWNTNITNGIQNSKSFGIVKGDRLYLLTGGMYLVYGTWDNGSTYELRAVEDNEDTYIPTTTIGISAIGSSINVRQTLDEVNMLCRKKRNKLIGEDYNSETQIFPLDDYPLAISYFEGSVKYGSTFNMGFNVNQTTFKYVVGIKIDIVDGSDTFSGYIKLAPNGSIIHNSEIVNDNPFFNTSGTQGFGYFVSKYDFVGSISSSNVLTLTLAFGKINATSVVNCYLLRSLVYQLDTTSVTAQTPKVIINGTVTTNYTNYFNETETFYLNADGTFAINTNFPPTIEGESNIIVEFDKGTSSAGKINNCRFGIIFGYNDIEHLFISGNSSYPNYDYHTSYPDSSETQSDIPVNEDLTYFGDLSYAMLGSIQSKIMGYTLLEDNTLAIHKESHKIDPAIYFRTSRLVDVLDLSGNVVLDNNGNPYQKVGYPIYAGSIGEGMLTRFASANLSGDKLFLSSNGVFGTVYNTNIKSNERFARERSRLVNTKLLKEQALENACGIVYNNRYYLSINNHCYIADSRFKNQQEGEMLDTFSYEWWYWDNVPAKIFFIYNGNLAFGTNNGQICLFDNENFVDRTYITIGDGGVSLDLTTDTFTLSLVYDEYLQKLKEGESIRLSSKKLLSSALLGELVLNSNEMESVVNGVVTVDFDTFINKVRYYENQVVYLDNLVGYENTPYIIKNLNNDNLTFELHLYVDPLTSSIDTTINTNQFLLIHIIENEDVYLKNLDYDTGKFQIAGKIVDTNTGELIAKEIYSYPQSVTQVQNNDLVGYFNMKDNVESYWATPIFDLGTSEYSKNLYSITFTPEAMISGKVEFGFTTRNVNEEFELEGINLFDFNDIDFISFTFETSTFAKSFTKKLKVKNVNFIMFYFKSDNDKDCVVNNMSITYEIGRLNKGVK